MKLSYIESIDTVLKDTIYYHITVFPEKGKNGSAYPIAYKRKRNAEKVFNKLVSSQKYYSIVLRKEDITIQDIRNDRYFGISSVEKIYTQED